MDVRWLGLYAIVDPEGCAGRGLEEVTEAILAGGCGVLQLRVKAPWSDRRLLGAARRTRDLCRRAGVPFVVNDRPDVARIVDADGLHLGQDDVTVADARRVVGSMCVGVSTHDEAQAAAAVEAGADLLAFGPIFATRSKADPDPTVGLERLGSVSRTVPVPVVAIGGIDAGRAGEVAEAGAALVAAISALCGAPDPAAAARSLHAAVLEAWR